MSGEHNSNVSIHRSRKTTSGPKRNLAEVLAEFEREETLFVRQNKTVVESYRHKKRSKRNCHSYMRKNSSSCSGVDLRGDNQDCEHYFNVMAEDVTERSAKWNYFTKDHSHKNRKLND